MTARQLSACHRGRRGAPGVPRSHRPDRAGAFTLSPRPARSPGPFPVPVIQAKAHVRPAALGPHTFRAPQLALLPGPLRVPPTARRPPHRPAGGRPAGLLGGQRPARQPCADRPAQRGHRLQDRRHHRVPQVLRLHPRRVAHVRHRLRPGAGGHRPAPGASRRRPLLRRGAVRQFPLRPGLARPRPRGQRPTAHRRRRAPGVDDPHPARTRRPGTDRHAHHPVPARRAGRLVGCAARRGGVAPLRRRGPLRRPTAPPGRRLPPRRGPFRGLRQRRRGSARPPGVRPRRPGAPGVRPVRGRRDPRRLHRGTRHRTGAARPGRRHQPFPPPHADHPLPRRRPGRVDRHRAGPLQDPRARRGGCARGPRVPLHAGRPGRRGRGGLRGQGGRHAARRPPLGRPGRARPAAGDGPGDDARGQAAGGREALAEAVVAELETVRPLYPDSVRAGFVHPLSVEWARHRDLAVNPRTGKLVRVLDERPTA